MTTPADLDHAERALSRTVRDLKAEVDPRWREALADKAWELMIQVAQTRMELGAAGEAGHGEAG